MLVTTLCLWVFVAAVTLTEARNGMNSSSSLCTSSCSTQSDVICATKRLPYPCLMPDLDGVDHPNKPRNLMFVEHSINNTRVIKLSWLLPKGFSYRAVKGFWMEVNTLMIGHQCYYFNLSTVNWSKVKDVQNVNFTHCLTYNTTRALTVFINLYSLPKATVDVEKEKLELKLPALEMTKLWNPNISAVPNHENLTVTFGPWLEGATYVRGCLAEIQKNIPPSRCMKQIRFSNRTTHSWFHNVPCNKTYRVLIRSYVTRHARSRAISDWVKDPYELVMPCYTPEPTTVMTQLVMKPAKLDAFPMILLSLLLLCLLVVSLVIIWFRRTAIGNVMDNLGCCKDTKPPSQDQVGNNECNERVFPIYFPENDTYENAVIAHIHLLHRKYGINIETYDDQRPLIMQDMHEWVNENLKTSTVLIYYSKTIADFKKGSKMPEDCRTFGHVCHYAMQRLEKLELAGQAVEPIHVTFDGLNTCREYEVEDMISLVKEENEKLYIENFDTIVYKLSGGEVQNFDVPNEAETRDLRIYVSELYDVEFLDDDDGLDAVCSDFPEQEPMMHQNLLNPFHKSDVYRQDMGSTDSCRGSELPCPGQCHHHGDMFVNPLHHHPYKHMPYSPLTGGVDKSMSSGYNSGTTGPFYSGEYIQLQEQGLTSRPAGHKHVCHNWECGHLLLDLPKTDCSHEQTYRNHVCCGQGVDRTAPEDSESTYTLELDHLGHPPRMLNFIAPEIPASRGSLTHIQEEFQHVNQTSGF